MTRQKLLLATPLVCVALLVFGPPIHAQDFEVPEPRTTPAQETPPEPYANQTRTGLVGHMEIIRYHLVTTPNGEYEWELREWESRRAFGWVGPKPSRVRIITRTLLRFPLYCVIVHWKEGGKMKFCVSANLYDKLNPGIRVEVPYNQEGPVGVRIAASQPH